VTVAPTRNQAIEALFAPALVRAYSCPATPALVDTLRPEERSSVHKMAAGRQAEFATARACARAALADFEHDAAVPRQDGGAPLWPDAMAGSISHTRGFCLAVVGPGDVSLGIDAEEAARLRPAIERRILVPEEQARADQLDDAERGRHVAAVFAAKEAFYKAHYEVDARYLGFDAVTVHIDHDRVRFSPASGAVDEALLGRASGRILVDGPRVIVGITLAR
jgi:4'-phosphopantetheinyl transferase EntD